HRLPHVFELRARRRDDGRVVLLPRSHRARPPGGLGGAEGPRHRRARRGPGLLELSDEIVVYGRDRSSATPSPDRSSRAGLRPVMATSSDTIGPDTSGPSPWVQSVSVARSRRPAMRRLAPITRFEPL